jgi:hypothetical protein
LFYRGVASSEKLGSVWVADVTTKPRVSFGKARVLFEGNFPSTTPVGSYSVSSDGRRFLMREKGPQRSEPVTHINLTLNWFEELKRLVPTE